MSKKIINALKSKVKELKYQNLKAREIDYHITYTDLIRVNNIIINGTVVTNEVIRQLLGSMRGESTIFHEMFRYAGATVPNDLIIKELAANYNQAGYIAFFYESYSSIYDWEGTGLELLLSFNGERTFRMDCYDPNRLKFSFIMERIPVTDYDHFHEVCNLSGSVEFEMKYENGNVIYENGRVLLTIPRELEDYRAGNDGLLDKLTDIINKIVEYLKKLCEKLGFKFDTKIEYNSERNINIGHNLGKPLLVIDKPDIYAVNGLRPREH